MAQDSTGTSANTVVLTADLAAVVAGNPGLNVSITALFLQNLKGGCIRYLRYGSSDKDLDQVAFDNGDLLTSSTNPNLNDFRENFECAAKFGMGCTLCVHRETKIISMVNLYPCLCTCPPEEGKGHGQPASAFVGLSGK